MPLRRASLLLLLAGVLLALWPVKADATRYELEAASGALSYTQDTSLRRGCAGPIGRSMSLAVLVLVAAAGVAVRRRTPAGREPVVAA